MTDISEFTNLYQEENEKLFEQGIWLAQHCVDKKSEAEIKAACGIECGASADTINKRLRVGRVFGDQYYVDCNWSLHVAACELAKADGKDEQARAAAYDLMDTAIKGYVDDNGHHRPHTAKTLKRAIRAARDDGQPRAAHWFKGEAQLVRVLKSADGSPKMTRIELLIPEHLDIEPFSYALVDPETVTVTITRRPQPARAEASKAVAV